MRLNLAPEAPRAQVDMTPGQVAMQAFTLRALGLGVVTTSYERPGSFLRASGPAGFPADIRFMTPRWRQTGIWQAWGSAASEGTPPGRPGTGGITGDYKLGTATAADRHGGFKLAAGIGASTGGLPQYLQAGHAFLIPAPDPQYTLQPICSALVRPSIVSA